MFQLIRDIVFLGTHALIWYLQETGAVPETEKRKISTISNWVETRVVVYLLMHFNREFRYLKVGCVQAGTSHKEMVDINEWNVTNGMMYEQETRLKVSVDERKCGKCNFTEKNVDEKNREIPIYTLDNIFGRIYQHKKRNRKSNYCYNCWVPLTTINPKVKHLKQHPPETGSVLLRQTIPTKQI